MTDRGHGSGGHPALRTPFCELVGVEHPVVQTGMGWVSGARLTAATAQAGGLGILASATMSIDELARQIAEVKQRTDRPFGVNYRADQSDLSERLDLMVREHVRVASFASPPSAEIVKRLKGDGVVVIPTVGAPRHAEKMAGIGVDAVIAQGMEGGGHTGEIPTSLLIPACVDKVEIPVVAAGGFCDGRGLVAALAWGAQGIAMGTRFLLTAGEHGARGREAPLPRSRAARHGADHGDRRPCPAGDPHRARRSTRAARPRSPVLPRAVANALRFRGLTGTSLRALIGEGLAMRRNEDLTWSQLAMAANAPMLTKAAMVDGHPEVGILPTGQVVGEIDALPPVAEVIEGIVAEAEETLAGLCG